ncbi:MAG: protein translocase subunit SecD [Nitrospinota bacterium]|nr:protein translocase subunit SecD [Nitrospinota bacterium]
MHKELRWKIPLILFVLGGFFWLAWPVEEKINLGLDLQGGMHLVLEVEAEKAVEFSMEQRVEDIKHALGDEDIEVDLVTLNKDTNVIRVVLVDPIDIRGAETVLKNFTALEKKDPLRDGLELVYQLREEEIDFIKDNAVQQGMETIRNRIDQFGVAEPSIQVQGERRILVQLPGIKDADRAVKLIGKTARLEFKMIDESMTPEAARKQGIPPGSEILIEQIKEKATGKVIEEKPYLVKKRTLVTGDMLTAAEVRFDSQFNEPYVAINFNSLGGMIFGELTSANVGKRLAIVLDDHIYSAPVIREKITGGRAQVSGSFTPDEARDLAIALRAGALPAPVTILENRTVGPSLGRDSVEAGINSVVIGMIAVVLFILIYYRLAGVVAVGALLLNLVMLLGALAYFGASLTLPGIAGIILTVGMAIDANVLVFERIREEIRIGKTVRAAIDAGFAKAFRTIVDANVTTFIAAIVLFQFGTGPIKGFAITLCIGIAASMFTAVFVSRTTFDAFMSRKKIERLSI